ncbi:hypothetical protein [Bacillus thuringiensis]|uniref:Uncharacterized protein n=1 Tax=Bacillus thuringiensis TaxID=1428 RepID=A0A9X6TSS1_BACTU|nr:hypothetical protein [Bacillus thuringiensis]PEA91965.1 hypothetical protein CON71_00465 [Bacillus thuringiensis]
MKKPNQLNVEEFRVIHNFTIDQMIDILKISESSYEGIKDKPVVCYSYRPEIKDIFIEEVEKEIKEACERYGVHLCTEKENIIENTLKCSDERITHSMYILFRSFIEKSISY